jgi:hypothetical protein
MPLLDSFDTAKSYRGGKFIEGPRALGSPTRSVRNFSLLRSEYVFVKTAVVWFPHFIAAAFTTTLKEIAMHSQRLNWSGRHVGVALSTLLLTGTFAAHAQNGRTPLVITSTNDPGANSIVVFRLNTSSTPSLSLSESFHTNGKGGASTDAGIVQFRGGLGAVANYGSNSVNQLVRYGDSILPGKTIQLAADCAKPDSLALTDSHLFVVGATCAETHSWPAGLVDGAVVSLSDPSAAQIAVGETWAAVTLSSGSLLQLPLANPGGALDGTVNPITLPADANNTPLGEAFWHNVLGFTPAHSPNSFAIVDENRNLSAVPGPTPSFPVNAPCWVAKGPGNIWYTGNSPGDAISIFFSDGQSGVFYKSVPLPGSPTDVAVSPDRKWLAVIYSTGGEAYVAVFSIDNYGDLTKAATSNPIGVASFSGVAISE